MKQGTIKRVEDVADITVTVAITILAIAGTLALIAIAGLAAIILWQVVFS